MFFRNLTHGGVRTGTIHGRTQRAGSGGGNDLQVVDWKGGEMNKVPNRTFSSRKCQFPFSIARNRFLLCFPFIALIFRFYAEMKQYQSERIGEVTKVVATVSMTWHILHLSDTNSF